jgi:hypothetical protein
MELFSAKKTAEKVTEKTVPSDNGLFDQVYTHLSENQLFTGGAGLAVIGLAVKFSNRLAIISNALFRRRFVISLSLNNDDA